MNQLILFFFMSVTIFIGAVAITAICKHCSVQEATAICKSCITDIVKELFHNQPPQQHYYPVLVGYDGTRIVSQFVDLEFKKLASSFDVCYFTQVSFTPNGNIVVYHFSIQRKQDFLSDDSLEILLQKQAEEVLTKTLHDFDCYLSAESLTAIKLRSNDLLIAYARTEDGIGKLDELKRQSRRKYQKQRSTATNFNTDWRKL